MSCGLSLNFYVSDREKFNAELVSYVRENLAADGNIRIEHYSDSWSIQYATMIIDINVSYFENYCRLVEDMEDVRVNFDMTCWLYHRTKYREGVIDSAKILKYYLSNYKGDCVWAEEGNTILVRRNGAVSFSFAAGTTFPVRWSQEGEFYSVDYRVIYRGMEFKPREMKKEHLEEGAVTVFTI